MPIAPIQNLRKHLGLSRSELARFLGVSEATVTRWEADRTVSEPRGLQAVLLTILVDAMSNHPGATVARAVRSCSWDHRDALKTLLDFSDASPAKKAAPLSAGRR